MENQQSTKKWYEKRGLLILLFFIFPPLGIYGMLQRKTATWKKVVYILPSAFISLFLAMGIYASLTMDKYATAIDYYNKKDYENAYYYFSRVSSDDKNYDDAIAKIEELKPIVDSINLEKEKMEKAVAEEKRLAKEQKELAKEQKELEKEQKEREKAIAKNPVLVYPEIQQKFIKVIEDMEKEYEDAPNELKKSAVRAKRGKFIKEVLGNTRSFNNWIVKVRSLETTSNGKAIFLVKIDGTSIDMGTTNNEFSDIFENTLIDQSSPLYNIIAELNKGDKVLVSGTFLPSDRNELDYIEEYSITEKGSMTAPHFAVRFKTITKQ
ncbi:hypothetical protein [Bergeyella zoohelcum]|uniref:Uncharacterized protein n=1 Tax=Bergeyella zoohelcum TaxID=1015 RepID=A0A7Z9CFY4_9FLAO|nr:hypothetical protein [Bergeyella zoohelcum]VDH04083.1 Uncharacterised protein [Bergeyella zoohelcum]